MTICTEAECANRAIALGLCALHYQRVRAAKAPPCQIEYCTKMAGAAKGLCPGHYRQGRRGEEMRPLRGSGDPRDNLWRHGLTHRERDELLASQRNRCAACGKIFQGDWAIDHDHSHCPGRRGCKLCIRAALCGGCNTALGMLGDSANRARRLADYIERFGN